MLKILAYSKKCVDSQDKAWPVDLIMLRGLCPFIFFSNIIGYPRCGPGRVSRDRV